MIKPEINIEYYAEGKAPSFTAIDWQNIVIHSDCVLPIEMVDAIMHNVRSTVEDPLHCVTLHCPHLPHGPAFKLLLYSYGGRSPERYHIEAIACSLACARVEQPHKYAWMQAHEELVSILLGAGLERGSNEFLEQYHRQWFKTGPLVEEALELPDLGDLS